MFVLDCSDVILSMKPKNSTEYQKWKFTNDGYLESKSKKGYVIATKDPLKGSLLHMEKKTESSQKWVMKSPKFTN
jgi:hypothetical protein